jgi:hypothetical protein
MRFMWFRRRRGLAAICRARPVLAAARPIGAITVTPALAGAVPVFAATPVRAICIDATLEADQTVLVGVAADQTIAAIELRAALIPTGENLHRVACAVQLDTGRLAPASDTGLAFAAVDWVRRVLVAAFVLRHRTAAAIATDLAVAAILVAGALDAGSVMTEAVLAVVVVATLTASASTAVPITAVVVVAAFGAGTAMGLPVVAATQLATTRTVQMIGGGDELTPIALNSATTLALGGAVIAVAANLVLVAIVTAITVVAALAVAAIFVTATLGAIATVASDIVVIGACAAVLAVAAAGLAPAVVAVFAGARALPVVAALHTMVTAIATGG